MEDLEFNSAAVLEPDEIADGTTDYFRPAYGQCIGSACAETLIDETTEMLDTKQPVSG